MKYPPFLIILALPWIFSCASPDVGADLDPIQAPSVFTGDWFGYQATSGGSEWDAEHRAAFGSDLRTRLWVG